MADGRFRLRKGDEIVGYEAQGGTRTRWSRDGHTWSGTPISHTARDPWVGISDVTRKRVYVHDVVQWDSESGQRTCEIVHDGRGGFALLDLTDGAAFPLSEAPLRNDLRVIGYRPPVW